MKKNFIYLLLAALISFLPTINAQQHNYPIKVINGVEYYVYTVEAGEGLYSISRRFGVTQVDINNVNPQIHDGLKAGQDILIPKKNEKSSVSSPPISDNVEYVLHTVERRQTLFAISRKYDVTQNAIVQSNPVLRDRGIQPGDVLRIPVIKKPIDETPAQPDIVATPERPEISERTLHISTDKTYITHNVAQGETLFAISRKYKVTQNAIVQSNPVLRNRNIQPGDVLRIPVVKKTTDAAPVQPEVVTPAHPEISERTLHVGTDTTYITHNVAQGETLFAISRKYKVTRNAIVRSNPVLRNRNIQPGDVLRIPVVKKTTDAAPVQPEVATPAHPEISERTLHVGTDKTYITHNVAKGETLYSISRKYKVSVKELKQLNPDTEKGLMAGSILKIPFKGGSSADSKAVSERRSVEPAVIVKPREPKTSYKVAYLLPFMQDNPKDATAGKFIEFYLGSLLAIHNAKSGEMKFEIHSFDTEKTETKIYEIINKPEMQDMDLIIGPAYTAQIPILADFAKRRKIYTVIPFSSKVAHIQDNPYLFQFNPDLDTQNDYIANLLRYNFKNTNILFVETENARWSEDGMDFFGYLKQRLDRHRIAYSIINSSVISSNLSANLTSDRKNILIFDTDDYKTVHADLATLYEASTQFDIGVLGQYSWRNYIGKKPKMYYVSPFAGNKSGTEFYEQQFKKYFGDTLPIVNPRFDILGYDITTYFLSLMKRDGFAFDNSTHSLSFNRGVQSNFEFQRAGQNGGFVNKKLYLIEDEAASK